MFKNYLKITLRNINRNKSYSIINVLGLAIGMACCILSYCFINDELRFDRFHKNLDEIFEVKGIVVFDAGTAATTTKAPLGPTIPEQFPEVISAVRMTKTNLLVKYRNQVYEHIGIAADPGFFKMFSFPLLSRFSDPLLSDPNAVVINKNFAEKFFGQEDPLGKTLALKIGDVFHDFIVKNIIEIPDNSSIKFDYAINLEKIYGDALSDWTKGPALPCFIQLQNRNQAETLQNKFKDTIDIPLKNRFLEGSGYRLQAFAGYHLGGQWGSSVLEKKSSPVYSLILAGISILVLLIACFNFMNLAIGNSSSRLKEIGMRKVLGAHKKQLIKQFWFESIFQSFLSLLIGLALAEFFSPAFNRLSQKSLHIDLLAGGIGVTVLLGVVLIVGILAGSYPALVLSGFSSIDLFRGKLRLSRRNTFSRILIVFQFGISIFLIIITTFLYKQHYFMLHKNLGYDGSQLIVLPLKNISNDYSGTQAFFNEFKASLLQNQNVQNISASQYGLSSFWMATYFEPKNGEKFLATYNHVDHDFVETLGMHLIKGRNFNDKYPSDLKDAVIVNQALVKTLGIESPIGSRLSEYITGDFDRKIIGVVSDFHLQSLHESIYPTCIDLASDVNYEQIFVKIRGDNLIEAVSILKKEFSKIAPDIPFEYSFLDEDIAGQYTLEKNWSSMINYTSVFALLIACSGLFGLTLLVIARKRKEIGIRKVLGASLPHIFKLLQREFIWLIIAANVIAWPAAYYTLHSIFQDYAYRVELVFWVFLAAGGTALFLAMVTISLHALKAEKINPAQILKYE